MPGTILLTTREGDGETIVEGLDTRHFRKSGGSIVSSYPLDILEGLGFIEDGEIVDHDLEHHIMMKPESETMVIETRVRIPDTSWLDEMLAGRPLIEPDDLQEPAASD